MKKLIRVAMIVLGITLMISLMLLAGFYFIMTTEGYPTWEGARNILNRDGQIRIILPDGYQITDVRFEADSSGAEIEHHGSAALIRCGYVMGVH